MKAEDPYTPKRYDETPQEKAEGDAALFMGAIAFFTIGAIYGIIQLIEILTEL